MPLQPKDTYRGYDVPRKHHVVSAGYLRLFGEERKPGKFMVRMFSKDGRINDVVPVEKILWRRGLHTAYVNGREDDALEDEFARIEKDVLPIVARVVRGEWSTEWGAAIKALMALHLARSYRYQAMFSRAVEDYFANPLEGMSIERLTKAFETQYGRRPEEGELDALVREHVDRWRQSNVFYVSQSAEAFNKTNAMLADKYVELVWVRDPAPRLLTGDSPLVVANGTNWRRVRVALGDAELIYMPLSPTLAASLVTGRESRPGVITRPSAGRKLNRLMWRNCDRFLVAHPASNWRKSLGQASPREAELFSTGWSRRRPGRRDTKDIRRYA